MKRLLNFVIVIQLCFLLSILISKACEWSYFRELVGFVYLTFVPGLLILLILKVNIKNGTRLLLYSIGLSLTFLMFTGLFINTFLPLVGISKPISEISLLLTLTSTTLMLWVLCYHIVREEKLEFNISLSKSVVVLLLSVPIVASVLRTLVPFQVTYMEFIMILMIVIITIVLSFKSISSKLIPLIIWVIAISLLLPNSLVGEFFRLTDNVFEFYLSNLVIKNGYWIHNLPTKINAMLGVIMVIPIYSTVCSIDLVHVFRIVVPFLSSFIPLGLYEVYKKLFDEKISIFATFFFMFMYEYYTWLGLTMKMVTAGLYLTLLLLVVTDDELDEFRKAIFSVFFTASLAVSHYGTSYIFMFCLVGACTLIYIVKKIFKSSRKSVLASPGFVIFYITFAIGWYMYVSSSSPYDTMVNIGKHIIESIVQEYILPEKSYGYQVIAGQLPTYLQILKGLYVVTTALITIGIFNSVRKIFRTNPEYIVFAILFYISGGTVFLGGLSRAATPDRIYQIISFFLAPFCVIGWKILFGRIKNLDINLFSLFLAVFLLFNTCFAAEVIWHYNIGPTIYLSKDRIMKSGTLEEKEYLDRVYLSTVDVYGAKWLAEKISGKLRIYAGKNAEQNLLLVGLTPSHSNYGTKNIFILTNKTEHIRKSSYIYLTEFNTETKFVKVKGGVYPSFIELSEISTLINSSSIIYSNGKCSILFYS